ncbi:MAG: hypothetical protein RMK79_01860, partial [Anaerolineae bacterium]|nr:hypothetical protein [Anaerolineae bacterium]
MTILSLDAQCPRESKRDELPAVQVLVVTAQPLEVVLQQRGVAGDIPEATLALSEETLLEGRGVRVDARLLQRRLVEGMVKKGRGHRLGEGQPQGRVSGGAGVGGGAHGACA